jgi:hypothetical protein
MMFGLPSDKKLTPICRQDFVMRGSKAKNQHLLFEILSSATDTEKNVTKFLI